jgi:two-component system sensor histidine kinase BaeS
VNVHGRLSLRVQLALALVAVAVLGIGIATLFSNFGLPGLVNQAAHARLERQAGHLSSVAAAFYAEKGRWTPAAGSVVVHEGRIAGIEAELLNARGKRIAGRAGIERGAGSAPVRVPILVEGKQVGVLVVTPLGNQILTPEEQHLRHSLDRLHLLSAGVSALAALLVALLVAETLTRPLRRIRLAAERMEEGELDARVDISATTELAAVGHALNRLAATLEHEEEVRRESVADLAHELRTPVSGLLSRIEAAQDGVLEDVEANLEAMHAEALRLSVLLDDLTRLAEAQRPGMLIEKHLLDLATVGEEQAFTRFWRGEKSRSRETGGAGIGLAIVAELVHAHDGRIDVESRLSEGSTFRVTLPLAARLHE